jgi:hypothetical protein
MYVHSICIQLANAAVYIVLYAAAAASSAHYGIHSTAALAIAACLDSIASE